MRQKADVSIQEGGREDQSSEVTIESLAVQRLLGYALVTKEQQAAHSSYLWPLPPHSCFLSREARAQERGNVV